MFFLTRRKFLYFDWISFGLILVLSSLGLLFIFSVTHTDEQYFSIFFNKQLFGILAGILIYFTMSSIDNARLKKWGYYSFFAVLIILILVLIRGNIGLGARRWINLGFFKFQPSELAKLFFPPFVVYYLETHTKAPEYLLKDFFPLFVFLIIASILILKQPDLGTAIILIFSGITIFWLAGLSKKFFIYAFCAFLLVSPIAVKFLKPYQKKRIEVFLGAGDRTRERYQSEQSKIAVGSGGLKGKGILEGTQNRLRFLPESRTDFIFSVVCEEWGLLGACLILLLYALLFLHLFYLVFKLPSFFHKLLTIGLMIHIMYSALINILMVIGLLPIVGIPLPFMSYGITYLWICFASLGWFNNIAMRRF